MENLFKEMRDEFLCQNFCQKLATKFSHSVHRSEKFPVKWEQVQSWFQDKQSVLAAKASPSFYSEETLTSPAKKSASTISIGEAAVELPNLMFEARSSKDYAWFDVAYFLNFRVLNLGELMVRVRFVGFDIEEDEWVSADRAIRECSIPLVPTECNTVNSGDQVLCYRVNEYHALYVDAHILESKGNYMTRAAARAPLKFVTTMTMLRRRSDAIICVAGHQREATHRVSPHCGDFYLRREIRIHSMEMLCNNQNKKNDYYYMLKNCCYGCVNLIVGICQTPHYSIGGRGGVKTAKK